MNYITSFLSIGLLTMSLPLIAGQSDGRQPSETITAKESVDTKATEIHPNQVVMEVHGIVCSFCSQGIKKKLSKFTFIDRTRLNEGILMDVEHQRITVAIESGVSADIQGMFDAVLSGGYEPISALVADANGLTNKILADKN